ncbi:TRAP transporter small permease [Kushneria sp. AK178]
MSQGHDAMKADNSTSTPPLLRWLNRGRELFYVIGSTVVVVTTAVIGITLMAGVIVRYFLAGSLAWGNELPVILFPWLIMGGVVMAAARHQHLGVDFFARKLSSTAARVLMIVVRLMVVALMVMLIQQSFALMQFMQYQTTPVLGWPATWSFYSLPLGAAGVLLLAVIDLIGVASGAESPIQEELTP